MPVDRAQARSNLIALIQFQTMRQREYGDLLLAVWYAIEEQLEDVYVLEVYERFASPEGEEHAMLRFPGMANMWIPGLYHIAAYSRRAFEQNAGSDELIALVRAQLAAGAAEVLWPPDGESPLMPLVVPG
jgi:hypothetical protein